MTITVSLAALMTVAVVVLVAAELRGWRTLVLVAKPVASVSFLLLGWGRFHPGHPYDAWVLLALLLCLFGDVLLMFRAAFIAGLASFLLGHLAYTLAFAGFLPPRSWSPGWAMPVLLASVVVARWLWPHLGRLRYAVLAYIAVITVMVWGAVAITAAGRGPWFLSVGAVLFYLSDLAVARDRFVARRFASRAWGVPAYYFAQLLLALTIGP
jgi:uncharacterized membrane protein YhhN